MLLIQEIIAQVNDDQLETELKQTKKENKKLNQSKTKLEQGLKDEKRQNQILVNHMGSLQK